MAVKKRKLNKFIEKIVEGLLGLSGAITTITVLLIVIFLFREGGRIFDASPVEDGYILVASTNNPVRKLTAEQVKNIFDKKIKLWSELGIKVSSDSIKTKRLNDYDEAELGKDYILFGNKINKWLADNPGGFSAFPAVLSPPQLNGNLVKVPNLNIRTFLGGKEWLPTATPVAQMGILPLILGTLWVSFGAILIAIPLALATSLFMSEIASPRVRNLMKPVIELLAGIPSVVYGFYGLTVIVPGIQAVFNLNEGLTGLAGSIILGIMALPTIITISEDALRTVPRSLKEASLALGATHWQTIRKVILPYSSSGITAGIVLGVGRAIGETMAVLMVTGNSAVIPYTFLKPLRTIPATIAAELGESSYGGLHFRALFALGCILFIITFSINLGFQFIARKRKVN
ncbi:MAG: phosphate ABC transporter permease subunit PstC [Bacteroidota bacterium]|nr:phosphate ABC transporter permease subunit PstC [Bacteroidota bacterium]